MPSQSRWSKFVRGAGVVGAVLLPVAALESRIGLWPFLVGFLLLAVGFLLAVLALLVGVARLALSARRGDSAEYPALGVGMVLGLLVVGVLGTIIGGALGAPGIHNISTDLDDPPVLRAVLDQRQGVNPHIYDADQSVGDSTLGEVQRAAFPDLTTLWSTVGVAEAVDRSVAVLEDMGLKIVQIDRDSSVVEATDTTFWFGFKDDVVVRLRTGGDATLVDVHSVSRVGQGDLGANAQRVRTFLEQFASR